MSRYLVVNSLSYVKSFFRKGGILFGFLFVLTPPFLEARTYVLTDFDDVKGAPFSNRDEIGSQFDVSVVRIGPTRQRVLSIQYKIVREGSGGWGLALNGLDAERYSVLTMLVKGERGGEDFEVGLKDTNHVERKVFISQLADIQNKWFKVQIPLSEFKGVNLSLLDNISFSFSEKSGFGQIYIDDIQFDVQEGAGFGQPAGGTGVNKVIIDGFNRANPTDLYLIYEADDSSLKLNASRVVKEGEYAMEMEYILSSKRPWGSWVSARWQSKEAVLDWRGAYFVKLWVKGDGSGYVLRFSVIDADGEEWVYDDEDVLKSTGWQLMEMPVNKFSLVEGASRGNGRLDLEQIRAYAILIRGTGGTSTSVGVKTTVGRVLVDQLYLLGQQMVSVWAIPPKVAKARKVQVLKYGNIDFNGNIFTELLNAPEQKATVVHFGKLIVNGKVGKISGKMEIASEGQEFGEAAVFSVEESTRSSTVARTSNPDVKLTNLQLTANNLTPYITQATLGSLFIDYSPYTFSPAFGFKGLLVEGDVDLLNYHAFILKHRFNSYTAGSRVKAYWRDWRLTGISVYFRETAKLNSGGVIKNGQLEKSDDFRLEEVQNDWVYTFELESPNFWDRLTVTGIVGYNRFNELATVDRTNAFEPVFVQLVEPPNSFDGAMVRGRFQLEDVFIPGLKIDYEYRNVNTQFKPRYRQSPVSFDDLESDQRGHNARFVESWRGFLGSVEYDTIRRLSDKNFFRRRFYWALGYYGFDNIDVAFNQEIRKETYDIVSNRTGVTYDKNERVVASEIYIRAQLSPRFVFFIIPRRELTRILNDGTLFAKESLYGKLEFFATTNLRILGEFRTTQFGIKDFEPKGFPFDDNFVRAKVEFNF